MFEYQLKNKLGENREELQIASMQQLTRTESIVIKTKLLIKARVFIG